MVIGALTLGRWWQSLLYNPGGIGEEFRKLRLPIPVAFGLLLLGWGFGLAGMLEWVLLVTVPLVVVGLVLVHSLASQRGWNSLVMVVFYVLLVFLVQIIYLMLVVMALLDSLLDFRRVARQPESPTGDSERK